jgi:hypothetical protein
MEAIEPIYVNPNIVEVQVVRFLRIALIRRPTPKRTGLTYVVCRYPVAVTHSREKDTITIRTDNLITMMTI